MGRHQNLEQCKRYDDYDRFATQHGCQVVPAKGAHVKIVHNGHTLAVHTTHGEPGQHTRSALKKLLAVLLALGALACAAIYGLPTL